MKSHHWIVVRLVAGLLLFTGIAGANSSAEPINHLFDMGDLLFDDMRDDLVTLNDATLSAYSGIANLPISARMPTYLLAGLQGSKSIQQIIVAEQAAAIAAGPFHTCALTTGGGVKCWGYNGFGQLGDGTTTNSLTPVDVNGLTSGVAAVAAGAFHTCAVTTGGGVKCWGENYLGQLGDGTTTNRLTPVDVSGLTSNVAAVTAGQFSTCALTTQGRVKCWGRNSHGQLGDGTTTNSLTPVDVNGLTSGVAAVAAGAFHTCAVTTGGGVKCWGENRYGQLGDGTTTNRLTPVDVSGLTSGVAAIAAENKHTCAVMTGGGVKCWGENRYGQLGDGTITDRLTPVGVSGLTRSAVTITAGSYHTCAMTTGGGVKCWGRNSHGQLGNGAGGNRLMPVEVTGLTSGVAAVAAGDSHTCAVTTGGGVKCWGLNTFGQLGDGTAFIRLTPVDFASLTDRVTVVAATRSHMCAVTIGGRAKCWGNNVVGQLGNGTTVSQYMPVDVSGLTNGVSAIAAGDSHTCAVTTGGGIKCWGYNVVGQLGDGTTVDRLTPVDVSGLASNVAAIATGPFHTCALTTGGGVKCWGYNGFGQLGDGTTTNRLTPVDVNGLTRGVAAIAAGWGQTCAVTTDGGVKCWGYNGSGELGDGTTTDRLTPVDVNGLTRGVVAVTVGAGHTCALMTGGGVKCWGGNNLGQLGDGTTTNRLTPVNVSGLTSGVAAIDADWGQTCAVTTGSGVKCWGNNVVGQLGDGTTINRSTPVDVNGLTGGVVAVTLGQFHTCAVTSDGGVKCWGANEYGQLGFDPGWTPVDVVGFEGQPPDTNEKVPVIFIPGIEGSYLYEFRDRNATQSKGEVWPNIGINQDRMILALDNEKIGNTDNPPYIFATDVFRKIVGQDIYESLLALLSESGYPEYPLNNNPNRMTIAGCDTTQSDKFLFVFPYDWRRSNAYNANQHRYSLKSYIDCIRRIHGDDIQVDIIGHSMGGLVARSFIVENPGVVRNLITLGSPVLGAPQAISVMLTGYQALPITPFIVNPGTLKILAQNFPGVHQLLPSQAYFALGGRPFQENGYDFNGNHNYLELYSYAIFRDAMDSYSFTSAPGTAGEAFHAGEQDDWTGDNETHYYLIHGRQYFDRTPVGIITTQSAGYQLVTRNLLGSGDGTVPPLSSLRNIDKDNSLNAYYTVEYCVDALSWRYHTAGHSDLPKDEGAQRFILDILQGQTVTSKPCGSSRMTADGNYITIYGTDTFTLTLPEDINISLVDGLLTQPLPGWMAYFYEGDQVHSLALPAEIDFGIEFGLDAEYMIIEILTGTGDNIKIARRYLGVNTSTAEEANFTVVEGAPLLAIDVGNNGDYDTVVEPTYAVTGNDANDRTAPTIALATTEIANGHVRVRATADDDGVGVDRVYVAFDDEPFSEYANPIVVDPDVVSHVRAYAIDKAGNVSAFVSRNIGMVSTYLPIVLHDR